jgi:hypothetical protein
MPHIDHPSYPVNIPAEIRMEKCSRLQYSLPSAAGAGYRWMIIKDSDLIEAKIITSYVQEETELPKNTLADVTLVLNAFMPGKAHLKIQMVRPWNVDSPVVARDIDVIISDKYPENK